MNTVNRIRTCLAGRGAFVAAALTLALALASCSERLTTVDPEYNDPEGIVSPSAQLIVWAEEPLTVTHYSDGSGPLGPDRDPQCPERLRIDLSDAVALIDQYQPNPPGSVRAMILDATNASRYDMMRRETNGGFRKVLDYPLRPNRLWLETGWESYDYTDPSPSGYVPASYVARGIVGQSSSTDSPRTNQGEAGAPLTDITFTAPCLPCDSTFRITWNPVPGAYRYWVHVYQFLTAPSPQQQLLASMPAPLNQTLPRDILVATMDSSVTSYTLRGPRYYEQPVPAGVRVLAERGTRYGQAYYVRIAAVNRQGRLVAVSRGDYGSIVVPSGYGLYYLHANIVNPRRPGIGPPFCVP